MVAPSIAFHPLPPPSISFAPRALSPQGWGCDPAAVRCPTFIYHGVKDAETPPVNAEHLHQLIEGSELVMLPETGHVTILLRAEAIILALVQKKAMAA